METGVEARSESTKIIILLNLGSLLLIFGALYLVKELALFYGAGLGFVAAIQSLHAGNATLTSLVASTQLELAGLHKDLLEAYVMTIVALGLSAAAFLMLIKRKERNGIAISRYVLVHGTLVVIYLLLIYLIMSDFSADIKGNYYVYLPYMGLVICAFADTYLEYDNRVHSKPIGSRTRRAMMIDPSKPFSNMLNLQENLFQGMGGELKIIDKHFNSTALANLHRLTGKDIANFSKITILSSREMLDSSFKNDVSDFKSELGKEGVGLEVKLMDEADTVDQHERIMMDGKTAYKIPPFNIINKRSEHIARINFSEANRRFDYLYGRAIKIENHLEKSGRESGAMPEKK